MAENPNSPPKNASTVWPDWKKQLAGLVLVLLVPVIFVFFKPAFTTLLITLLLAFILRYPINLLHRRFKLRYSISVFLVFFIFLLLSIWAFVALTGAVISTGITLLQQLQTFINAIMPAPPESLALGPIDLSFLIAPLQRLAAKFVITQLFGGPAGIVNGLGQLITNAADLMGQFAIIVTILLFFLLEMPITIGGIGKLFPENSRREYAILLQRSDKLLANFFFGSLLVVGFYWLLAYVLFAITGVSDPLIKGFIVGVPNFIPQVGGYISTVLVFIIALISGTDRFAMGPLVFAFVMMIIFMVASGIAYYFVDARVYSKSVKIPIWLILIGLMVFAAVMGTLGFLIAAAAIAIFGEFFVFTLKKIRGEDPYPGEPEPPLFTKYWER
ncbi:MAG TPA: AI-2E family transporter [Chloroflexota bacterium]|nr:AI-2E family transporter [Chloroflexota bacterium]HUM68853.1 AI-2E family transporter [Chloroflexota bacterium]